MSTSGSSSTALAAYSTGSASVDLVEVFYHYHPSIAAAVVASSAFFLISIPLAVLAKRTHMYLSWFLVAVALAESLGYALRCVAANNPSLGPFIVTELLILLAPNFLALVNYKVLGQVIEMKSPPATMFTSQKPYCRIPFLMNERGLIHGKRVAWIFFVSDWIGFFIQGAGGGEEASSDPSTQELGNHVIVAGLAFQVVFFGLFALLALYVYYSPLYNQPTQQQSQQSQQQQQQQQPQQQIDGQVSGDPSLMNSVFFALFVTIVLILLRNIYRLVTFSAAVGSYIPTHEWVFYIFDMLAIYLAMIVYTRWHFGLYLPNNHHLLVSPKQSPQQPTVAEGNMA